MSEVPPGKVGTPGADDAAAALVPGAFPDGSLADRVLDLWLRRALERSYDAVLLAPVPERLLRVLVAPPRHAASDEYDPTD